MAVAIKLPDMGTNVEECKVLCWRVQKGSAVKRGDILADIETDKAVAELESTAEGVLLHLVVKAGDLARTGDILAYVGKLGEFVGDAPQPAAPPDIAPTEAWVPVTPAAPGTLPAAAALSHEPAAPVAPPSHLEEARPVRVSLIVRNLAAKLGVDLARVVGTGPGGIITREDVQRASHEPGASAAATAPVAEQLTRAQAAVARGAEELEGDLPPEHYGVNGHDRRGGDAGEKRSCGCPPQLRCDFPGSHGAGGGRSPSGGG